LGSSNIQKSRLPLTEGGFSCGSVLTRGMARHPSKSQNTAAHPSQTCPKNEVKYKNPEVNQPLTLRLCLVDPETPGRSRGGFRRSDHHIPAHDIDEEISINDQITSKMNFIKSISK